MYFLFYFTFYFYFFLNKKYIHLFLCVWKTARIMTAALFWAPADIKLDLHIKTIPSPWSRSRPAEAFPQFSVCTQIPLCALMVSRPRIGWQPSQNLRHESPQVAHSQFLGHSCLIGKPADASKPSKSKTPECLVTFNYFGPYLVPD